MFHGDIAKFAPADLLIFLAHLNKEGVLTVRHDEASLSVSFRRGAVVDAYCEPVDDLILRVLRHDGHVSDKALSYLERARQETGLPLRQICESVDWLDVGNLGGVLAVGVRETVFRLFLLEDGEFRFAEIAVDANPFLEPFAAQNLTMDTAREVDEYREHLRTLDTARRPRLTTAGRKAAPTSEPAVRVILELAQGEASVLELVDQAPARSAHTVAALNRAVTAGWLELAEAGADARPAPSPSGARSRDAAFHAYRRSLRDMFATGDLQSQLRVLLGFGRNHFDCTLLLASRDDQLVGCRSWQKDDSGQLVTGDQRPTDLRFDRDHVFRRAAKSRAPFCGRVFPSPLLAALGITPPDGECALVPLGELDGMTLLVYGASIENVTLLPFLELLAWHLQPPVAVESRELEDTYLPVETDADDPVERMVSVIKELPSMPHVVTRIIELLADPDCRMSEVTETLTLDPALVAQLVKVSNSALYRGVEKSGSVNQAIVRLGTRTTRNLVVAVSTRVLFPMDSSRRGLWGKALWQHSVECGIAARRVAETVGGLDPDEAFVAGVLHDIGKVIILLNLPDEFHRIKQLEDTEKLESQQAEQRILGFDHSHVAARLLESWNMPAELVAAVAGHHAPAVEVRLARVVACGNELSHLACVPAAVADEPAAEGDRASVHADALGIAAEGLATIRETIATDFAECELFD